MVLPATLLVVAFNTAAATLVTLVMAVCFGAIPTIGALLLAANVGVIVYAVKSA